MWSEWDNTLMIRKSSNSQKLLRHCPTCESSRIRTIRSDYRIRVRGEDVLVPKLERDECPNCGEILFDPEAMRRIESFRKKAVAKS
jgi:YgiT-type zinc finger domain-containing protein